MDPVWAKDPPGARDAQQTLVATSQHEVYPRDGQVATRRGCPSHQSRVTLWY